MLYTSPWAGVEPTTSMVIATDCIGSCKPNYHTITATTVPQWSLVLRPKTSMNLSGPEKIVKFLFRTIYKYIQESCTKLWIILNMLTFFCYWNWNRKYDILFCGIMHNVQSMDISIRHPRLYTIYFISNYTLYKNAGFWLVNNRDFFFTNSGLALWICRIFTSCRCICIRFNFFHGICKIVFAVFTLHRDACYKIC